VRNDERLYHIATDRPIRHLPALWYGNRKAAIMTKRKVREYLYTDHKGRPRLRKLRCEPKAFYMDSWSSTLERWVPRILDEQLAFADRAMYHLNELLWALSADVPVYWCEGEKDADAIRGVGGVATSHWQGALGATRGQARWFASRGSGPIRLVVDVDRSGAGAACVLGRKRLLLGEGVKRSRIRIIAPPLPYKDAAEAIEHGRTLSEFRRPSEAAMTKLAAEYASTRSQRRESSDWIAS
jgi:hypothetical protein